MKKLIIFSVLFFLNIIATAQTKFLRDPFQANSAQDIQVQSNGTLSLDFNEISVADALQLLAQQANKNIVLTDGVQGNITLHLHQVTWERALNVILDLKNLQLRQEGNILLISSNASTDNTQPLTTAIIKIHYAKAIDLAALLKGANGNVLSKQGSASADPRTNTLWIQDQQQQIPQIRRFISSLDVPVKQVVIKARIVSVNQDCLQELGVKFGTVNTESSLSLGGLSMDMPIAINENGRFNIAIAKLAPNTLLDLELSALESEGRGKVISSPELTTADRAAAYIEAGEEVPYQEKAGSGGATTVAFKKAVLSLKVVPQIVNARQLTLNLTVNQDKLSSISVHGVPIIQTREVETQVMVNNGQTLVLGGIYEQTNHQTIQRIPFFGSLPVLGHLFRSQTSRTDNRELIIFVTPQVLG